MWWGGLEKLMTSEECGSSLAKSHGQGNNNSNYSKTAATTALKLFRVTDREFTSKTALESEYVSGDSRPKMASHLQMHSWRFTFWADALRSVFKLLLMSNLCCSSTSPTSPGHAIISSPYNQSYLIKISSIFFFLVFSFFSRLNSSYFSFIYFSSQLFLALAWISLVLAQET